MSRSVWLRTPTFLRALLPSAILMIAALVLGWFLRGGPMPFDVALSDALIRSCPAWLAAGGDLIGSLPIFVGVVVLVAIITFIRSAPRWSLAFVAGLGIELPVELIKVIIDRARPIGAHEIEAIGSAASYPSGHVARIIVLGGLLAVWIGWRSRRWRWLGTFVAGVVAGLVACSRIGAGVHWSTDVVGGVLVGVAWLFLAIPLAEGGPDLIWRGR